MRLVHEDCINVVRGLESNSIDSMVTDPPAGISFMNKSWDSGKNFIPFMTEIMSECLRVMKPGAHAFVWALPRTSHWTATALENSGFEIRDVVTHLFGSGFPKSLNLGDGWGTNLKPASEHWILCRKPISEKTIAANVVEWGTGGINIDESRVGTNSGWNYPNGAGGNTFHGVKRHIIPVSSEKGRFPANLILDEEAAELLDEQSGPCKTGDLTGQPRVENKIYNGAGSTLNKPRFYKSDNATGASRFFYCAKASQSERNAGLEDRETQKVNDGRVTEIDNPFQRGEIQRKNIHPTVKPFKLMNYLINMITPQNGIVLDPFMGSGSTGIAALKSGFDFIGIEKEKEYFDIAEKRIMNAS